MGEVPMPGETIGFKDGLADLPHGSFGFVEDLDSHGEKFFPDFVADGPILFGTRDTACFDQAFDLSDIEFEAFDGEISEFREGDGRVARKETDVTAHGKDGIAVGHECADLFRLLFAAGIDDLVGFALC